MRPSNNQESKKLFTKIIMSSSSRYNNNTCYNQSINYNGQQCHVSFTCNSNSSTPTMPDETMDMSFETLSSSPASPFSNHSTSRSSVIEETTDVILNMMKKELKSCWKATEGQCEVRFAKMDPWRRLMITWMCNVVDLFELPNQIVSVAVHYLDVSVAKNLVHSPEEYKLVSLTALHLAIKVYDYKIFPLEQLLYFSQTDISPRDVAVMERRIMTALDWMLHPPTSDCFIYQYSTILEAMGEAILSKRMISRIEHKAQELLRIAVYTGSMRFFRPSVVAYAAMLLAMDRLLYVHQIEMAETFTLEMQRLVNLTDQTEGFVEAIHEFEYYIDRNGSVMTGNVMTASPTYKDSQMSIVSEKGEDCPDSPIYPHPHLIPS